MRGELPMKEDKKLQFSLLENAKDFIDQAIIDAKQPDSRSFKYSLIHLASGLELLIKAILEKEHWSLLFDDVKQATQGKLQSGNFRSVDFGKAEERLANIPGSNLSKADRIFLKSLRDLRNKIVHFGFSVTEAQIKSLVQKGWAVFIRLYEKRLPDTYDQAWVYQKSQELSSFDEFVKDRLKHLRSKLRSSNRPSRYFRMCTMCSQDTLLIEDGNQGVSCAFCGEKYDIAGLALVSEGGGGSCPSCENGRLGFVLYNNEAGEFHCVLCGFTSEYSYNEECPRCGQVFWNQNHDVMCADCRQAIDAGVDDL
jgi:hypothetical protein